MTRFQNSYSIVKTKATQFISADDLGKKRKKKGKQPDLRVEFSLKGSKGLSNHRTSLCETYR